MYIRHCLALGALALVHVAATDLPLVPEVFKGKSPITGGEAQTLTGFQDGVLGVRDWNATSAATNTVASSAAAAIPAAAESKTSATPTTVESKISTTPTTTSAAAKVESSMFLLSQYANHH